MSITDRSDSESRRRFSVGTEIDDSDHPPGSIVIPITGDTPWHILAYDSGESTREITNPKSQSSHCPWSSKSAASCSQIAAAANLNATARSPILSIRTTMKLPSFAHRRHSRPSIFPSWRGINRSSKKSSGLSYSEPGSPKVSCWGKVLSEREKEKARKRKELKKASPSCCGRIAVVLNCVGDRSVRRRRNSQLHQLAGVHPAHVEEIQQPPEQNIVSNATIEPQQTPAEVVTDHPAVQEVLQRSQEPDGATEGWQESGKMAEAVGLGAMRRFSSGRRAESWCSDLVVEKEGTVAPRENSLS